MLATISKNAHFIEDNIEINITKYILNEYNLKYFYQLNIGT